MKADYGQNSTIGVYIEEACPCRVRDAGAAKTLRNGEIGGQKARSQLRSGAQLEELFIEKADYLHLKSSYVGRRLRAPESLSHFLKPSWGNNQRRSTLMPVAHAETRR